MVTAGVAVAVAFGTMVPDGVQVGNGVHRDQIDVGVGDGSAHTT